LFSCNTVQKEWTEKDLSIVGSVNIEGIDYFVVQTAYKKFFPIPKGNSNKARIIYYDSDNVYKGDIIVDSIIIRPSSITSWNDGEIVFVKTKN